jgi:hypothetical protein
MTRQRKYYFRQSRQSPEAVTRVISDGRLVDALSSGETAPGMQRGLTLPQVLGLTILGLAHFFDWATFVIMMGRHGLAAEANPLVVRIAEMTGLPGLTLAKVATVTFAAVLMLLIAPKRPKVAFSLLVFGILAGMVGGISNVASF